MSLLVPAPEFDRPCQRRARELFDSRAKPLRSLGRLELLAARIAGIQRRVPPSTERPRVIVFAADHDVARFERVSAYPQEVTSAMLRTYAGGRAAVSILARLAGASFELMDVGVSGGELALGSVSPVPGVRVERRAVRAAGAANSVERPALETKELEACLSIGADCAARAHADGVDLLALGEMGIGNTTAASAVVARLLDLDAERVTGPGAGLGADGLVEKQRVVARILARSRRRELAGFSVLADVGGLELAALAGAMLEAARLRIPVLLDGFIVTSAALGAVREVPALREFLLPATRSAEPGHAAALEALGSGLPLLDLGLCLGEGSAAALAIPMVRAACRLLADMASLEEVVSR
jgi:nicotinate-nucleotide--dimethylbenzimidazole phosphoribosyltransferase